MHSITEASGKQTPVSPNFQRPRDHRSGALPSPRHGRKSKHENDLKREEQLQAYTAWVNSQLKKRPGSRYIQDLPKDLKDGVALIQLIEVVAGEKLKVNENPTSLSSMKENVDQVLQFMAINNIKMHHTSSKEILEGNLKSTMRLILALAAHFKPGSVKQSVQYPPGTVPATARKIARTPSAAAAASEAAAAIAEASRAAASVGRHITSRYSRKHRDIPGTPPRSPLRVTDGTPMLPATGSPLLSTPRTASHSSREGHKSGRSTPGSGSTTPKGHFYHDASEHSGSDVDSGMMCSRKKSKETRLSTLTTEFFEELSVEQEAINEELGETKYMLLNLQKMLMEGRVENDEVPEEYSFLEGTDLKDQLTIVNSRLNQMSAEYDVLKTERNNFKEESVNLQGVKSGLTSRLTHQEEVIMQMKSELLKSSFMQQNRNAEIVELQRKLDERDIEVSTLRAELLRQERTIDRKRAELEDSLRDMEHFKYAEAASSRHYQDKDVQIYELRQRIVDLQEHLRNVATHEADISSRICNQDQKMRSFEEKILSPPPLEHLPPMNGVEYNDMFGYVRPVHTSLGNGHSRSVQSDNSGATTKVLYFTERTVTPFLATIPKRLGNITLRDFKTIFDHPGPYRFHFKALDPEFGTVKEEVIDDQDTLPGWEGKIVAWVEEDRGLMALNHHDNTDYDVHMNVH
ncbi:hypothetical protein QZH41_018616 [Actinostola sp. cb2023]|nr:hypothetical protein QZH41_018616 [Actinostola sp. cb2023]